MLAAPDGELSQLKSTSRCKAQKNQEQNDEIRPCFCKLYKKKKIEETFKARGWPPIFEKNQSCAKRKMKMGDRRCRTADVAGTMHQFCRIPQPGTRGDDIFSLQPLSCCKADHHTGLPSIHAVEWRQES
jgi:hypothetical protein